MPDLETIRQALIDLAALRVRVMKENDLVGRLFASLHNDESPSPTYADLDKAIIELEAQVPGFYVEWCPYEQKYGLFAK